MNHKWRTLTIKIAIILFLGLAFYSYFFRHFLDGDQFHALALQATGYDPAIINADEPEFSVCLDEGRLAIEFVFQTDHSDGIGSVRLKIDPFRKTFYDVEKLDYYVSPGR